MSQTTVLKVAMSCSGCSGAVQRALGKMEGIESFDVNLKEQKVSVIGNVEPQAVFDTVSKTGKKTAFWEEPVPVVAEVAADVAPETAVVAEVAAVPAVADVAPETAVVAEVAADVAPAPAVVAEAETKAAETVVAV